MYSVDIMLDNYAEEPAWKNPMFEDIKGCMYICQSLINEITQLARGFHTYQYLIWIETPEQYAQRTGVPVDHYFYYGAWLTGVRFLFENQDDALLFKLMHVR